MKLSNYEKVSTKISERNRLLRQKEHFEKTKWSVCLHNYAPVDSSLCQRDVDVSHVISPESIVPLIIKDIDEKLTTLHFELKELGVYTDTNEQVMNQGSAYYF